MIGTERVRSPVTAATERVASAPKNAVSRNAAWTGWPSLKRMRSARSSSADWYRLEGDLSSASITIASRSFGTLAENCVMGGTALCTCWLETSTGVSPTNGGRPTNISYNTTPSE